MKPRPNRLEGDRGFALAATVFLGAVALLVLGVVIARGVASTEVAGNQIEWEVALNIAEGELDAYLAEVLVQPDPDAVTTGQLAADLASRAAAVSAADAYAAAAPSEVVDAPGGEVVILKASDTPLVVAVGFVPDMAASDRKVRVVTASYEPNTTTITDVTIDYALMGGGDIDLSGSVLIEPAGTEPANVHTNGSLSPGSAGHISGGCGSESEDSGYNQPGCPASPVAALPTPQVEAIAYHGFAWYDLCTDGAHYGPAHPTNPGGSEGTPCAGPLTATPAGWTGGGTVWTINGTVTGVFFASGADITGRTGSGSVATLIAHRTYGPGETPRTCGQGTGGSIALSANSDFVGHPDTGAPPVAAVADGDVAMQSSDVVGLIATGEVFDAVGSGSMTLEGGIVATDRCDEGMLFNGNLTISYTGPFATMFEATTTSEFSDYRIGLRGEL